MIRYRVLMPLIVLLTGCSASGGTMAPVEDRTGSGNYGNTVVDDSKDTEARPYVARPASQPLEIQAEEPTTQPPPANSAATSLVSIADDKINHGDYAGASAALERALRHDPKNADLWHRLAQVRLRQSEYDQTESLALKSNALAGGDKPLMSRNWLLISKSRRLRGDRAGADEAEARSYQLSR